MTSPELERMAERAKTLGASRVVTLDLVRLIRDALCQVEGSDNFTILDTFLIRNGAGFFSDTGEWVGRPQMVTVDLSRCTPDDATRRKDGR